MSNEIKKYDEYIFKDGEYRRVASGNGSGVIIRYVDELPAVGEPGIIYVLNGSGGDEPEGNNKIIIKRVFLTENMLAYDFNGNSIEENSKIALKLQAENIGQDETILATKHLVLNIVTEPINDDLVNKIYDGKVYLRWEYPRKTKKGNTIFGYQNTYDFNKVNKTLFLISSTHIKEKNNVKYIHYSYDLSNWYHSRINEALQFHPDEYEYFDLYQIEKKKTSLKNFYPWSTSLDGVCALNASYNYDIFKEQPLHYEKKKNIIFWRERINEDSYKSILTNVFWQSYFNNDNNGDYANYKRLRRRSAGVQGSWFSHWKNFSIANVNRDAGKIGNNTNILYSQPCYDSNNNFHGYRTAFTKINLEDGAPLDENSYAWRGMGKKLGEKFGFNFVISNNIDGDEWEKVFPHSKFILINHYAEFCKKSIMPHSGEGQTTEGTVLEIQNWIRKLPY